MTYEDLQAQAQQLTRNCILPTALVAEVWRKGLVSVMGPNAILHVRDVRAEDRMQFLAYLRANLPQSQDPPQPVQNVKKTLTDRLTNLNEIMRRVYDFSEMDALSNDLEDLIAEVALLELGAVGAQDWAAGRNGGSAQNVLKFPNTPLTATRTE